MEQDFSQRNRMGAGGEGEVHALWLRKKTWLQDRPPARHAPRPVGKGGDRRAQSARQIARVKAPRPSVLRIAPTAIPGSAAAQPER